MDKIYRVTVANRLVGPFHARARYNMTPKEYLELHKSLEGHFSGFRIIEVEEVVLFHAADVLIDITSYMGARTQGEQS